MSTDVNIEAAIAQARSVRERAERVTAHARGLLERAKERHDGHVWRPPPPGLSQYGGPWAVLDAYPGRTGVTVYPGIVVATKMHWNWPVDNPETEQVSDFAIPGDAPNGVHTLWLVLNYDTDAANPVFDGREFFPHPFLAWSFADEWLYAAVQFGVPLARVRIVDAQVRAIRQMQHGQVYLYTYKKLQSVNAGCPPGDCPVVRTHLAPLCPGPHDHTYSMPYRSNCKEVWVEPTETVPGHCEAIDPTYEFPAGVTAMSDNTEPSRSASLDGSNCL